MKKVCTLLIALATVAVGNAQFQKGQIILGPSISFNGNIAKIDNTNIAGLPPQSKINQIGLGIGGDFVKMKNDNTGLGVKLNYTLYSYKIKDTRYDQKHILNSFSVGLLRTKFYSIAKKWLFYYNTSASIGYASDKNNYDINVKNDESKQYTGSLALSLEPGIAFKLKNNLLLGINLNDMLAGGYQYYETYTKNNLGEKSVEKGSRFNLYTGLSNGLLGSASLNLRWIL